MARLYSTGFELNTFTTNVEFTSVTGIGLTSTGQRSGTYAARNESMSSGVAEHFNYQHQAVNGNGPFFYRFLLKVATAPTAANRFFQLADAGLTVGLVNMSIDNNRVLQLGDEDGSIGSPSSALSLDTWYRIEVKVDRTPAAGSHVVEAKLDGTVFATSSTRNLSTGFGRIQLGGNLAAEAQTTMDLYFDDIAINDSTGSIENSWLGEGELIHLRPNAAGDEADWTNDYLNIDEVTPDDGTTIISESSDEQAEVVNIDDTPAAVGSDDTINVVQVGVRFNKGAGTDNPQFCLAIKAAAAGTEETSANITANTTTWNTNAVAAPRNYRLTLYDLPGASTTAWTKADLDTAQIGVRLKAITGSAPAQVSTLWLLVDHKPAEGGGGGGGNDWPILTTNTGFRSWRF